MLCCLNLCTCGENDDCIANFWDFFLAISKFLMGALDAQQNFMLMIFVFFLSLRSKLIAFVVKNLSKLAMPESKYLNTLKPI